MRASVPRLVFVYCCAAMLSLLNGYLLLTQCCVLINDSSQLELRYRSSELPHPPMEIVCSVLRCDRRLLAEYCELLRENWQRRCE